MHTETMHRQDTHSHTYTWKLFSYEITPVELRDHKYHTVTEKDPHSHKYKNISRDPCTHTHIHTWVQTQSYIEQSNRLWDAVNLCDAPDSNNNIKYWQKKKDWAIWLEELVLVKQMTGFCLLAYEKNASTSPATEQ